MRGKYLAHSINDIGEAEPLSTHLLRVSRRAAEYAAVFGAEMDAGIAGLLHDVGKYGDLFQERLRREASRIDHWSPGAWLCLMHYRQNGIAAAAAIQGHHLGLQSLSKSNFSELNPLHLKDNHPLNMRLSETDLEVLRGRVAEDEIELPDPATVSASFYNQCSLPAARMLDVRMLYSALVDADFIETEAFFQEKEPGKPKYRPEGKRLEPERLYECLERYLGDLARGSTAAPEVKKMRRTLLNRCIESGAWQQGLYTLTAPTGSGKTLSLLAFALRHAAEHSLRRIIVVIPYLSIIEQTADSYRQALAEYGDLDDIVLENHSLAGTGDDDDPSDWVKNRQTQLLAENWDSPVIITTSVQFFESLFSSRPSACRKLHRVPGSVILFDEVQTLPRSLAVPTLAALSHLAERYRCTVVLSTATQPAFQHLEKSVRTLAPGGWAPREIASHELRLSDFAPKRKCSWPEPLSRMSWDEVASLMSSAEHVQSLCVVNLKRHALEVFRCLQEEGADGLFHLSTSMCPLHRRKVLADCQRRLADGQPCRLIATQCIEAGVDIDFPVVMRAVGPMDSVAQAAGRCNRHGKLPFGRFIVFHTDDEKSLYPDSAYAQASSVAAALLAQRADDDINLVDHALFSDYYRELYEISETSKSNKELQDAIAIGDFVSVNSRYRLIAQNSINVLVPYAMEDYEELSSRAEEGIDRGWIIDARPHCISVFRPREDDPIVPHLLPAGRAHPRREERPDDWFILLDPDFEFYSKDVGLIPFENTQVLIG